MRDLPKTSGWRVLGNWLGLIVLFLGMAPSARGQEPDISLWTVDSIRSNILGETRLIRVALPVSYNSTRFADKRYPILIVLDAQASLHFAATVANARALATPGAPAIPELIVIGVETALNRYRDMTLPPLNGPARTEEVAGGAPAFAEFLTAELLPYIASRYRTMPFTLVAGSSMTGLFAAYLYGHSPTSINAALAISPSLQWNGGVAYGQVLAGVRARTTPGHLFVAASRDESKGIDRIARTFARDVKRQPGVTVFLHRELVGDSHGNTLQQGAIDGLRFVFRTISLAGTAIERAADDRNPSSASDVVKAYADTRRRYLAGARALGLPERMPWGFNFLLSRWMLEEKNLVAAVPTLCEDIVHFYPALWQGQECFGRVWQQTGNLPAAEKAFREALRLAQQAGDAPGVTLIEGGLREILRARESKPF